MVQLLPSHSSILATLLVVGLMSVFLPSSGSAMEMEFSSVVLEQMALEMEFMDAPAGPTAVLESSSPPSDEKPRSSVLFGCCPPPAAPVVVRPPRGLHDTAKKRSTLEILTLNRLSRDVRGEYPIYAPSRLDIDLNEEWNAFWPQVGEGGVGKKSRGGVITES